MFSCVNEFCNGFTETFGEAKREVRPDLARFGSLKGRVICLFKVPGSALQCLVKVIDSAITIPLFLIAGILVVSIVRDHFSELCGLLSHQIGVLSGSLARICWVVLGILHPKICFSDPSNLYNCIPELVNALQSDLLTSEERQKLIDVWSATFSDEPNEIYSDENETQTGRIDRSIHKNDYRTFLIQIQDIFAGQSSHVLNKEEKLIYLQEMAEAFTHCVPGWGATLQQLVLAISEPASPLEKIGYWIDTVKRLAIDRMASSIARVETRNVSNAILEQIGSYINFKSMCDASDPYGRGTLGRRTKEDLLNEFYTYFKEEKVYDHLLIVLNEKTRAALRGDLLFTLAHMDPESRKEFEEKGEAQIAYKKFTTGENCMFNRDAVKLLAQESLEKMSRHIPCFIVRR